MAKTKVNSKKAPKPKKKKDDKLKIDASFEDALKAVFSQKPKGK